MPDKPKNIVYIRPDTIGDILIFSSALTELCALWPEATHTLVVRPGYDSLAPLFPRSIRWIRTSINPFRQKPSEGRAALDQLFLEIAALQPDLIVAPTPTRTWLEVAVAGHFPKVRSVALGTGAIDPLFANAVKLELGLDADKAFTAIAPSAPDQRDWENQHRLVDFLVGRPTRRSLPRVSPSADAQAEADRFLSDAGLAEGTWAALFPAGLANVPIKAWGAKGFAEVMGWLGREKCLRCVLLGHESEKPQLDEVAAAAEALGLPKPVLWLGGEGGLPVLAGLLRRARLYLGHDTGAMHLAAALDKPLVGIFGGGHWPRFKPAARRSVCVVQPLPCFGCNWDCPFESAPCVKTIPASSVIAAAGRLMAAGEAAVDSVEEARSLDPAVVNLIDRSARSYRRLQADRLDRQHTIEKLKNDADFLKAETDVKDAEINSLKAETDRKDVQIGYLKAEADTKDREIDSLKAESNSKDHEIDSLKAEADSKDAEIGSLKAEADTKDREIDSLKAEADTKDREISELKATCNERETLIITQDGHIKAFQKIVADLNAEIERRDARIRGLDSQVSELQAALAALEASKARVDAILAALPPDATQWSEALTAKENHIQNIEGFLRHRDQEIEGLKAALAERDQSLANYAAGLSQLEQAKHFSRLLAEKEAVIQDLLIACKARAEVISELAAEATRPTARLRKLWIATRAFAKERIWRPLDTWVFRKVVEQHWMQIGVLNHYEAKPIAWDKRIPKPRLAESRLPKIAIVTPSYQQDTFVESTLLSVINQNYPKLLYVVQDGGSKDRSVEIIRRYEGRLFRWESVRDKGQADAVQKGFRHVEGQLSDTDVMAWLNSDDFIAPKVLRYVGEYFATHPNVDVVYGHRIIIDGHDKDVGRWIMPRHDRKALEWIDYIPQETLFWRKRAWDLAGGIDPSFQFALDWDLLARFQQAGCTIVRLPYFLGCFRVHAQQKTSQAIHTVGAEEMLKIRRRFHGAQHDNPDTIQAYARKTRFRGGIHSRLVSWGIRW